MQLDLEIGPPNPKQYVSRFASDLDVSEETERRARELLSSQGGGGEAAVRVLARLFAIGEDKVAPSGGGGLRQR